VPLFFAFSAPLSTDPASDAFTDGFDSWGAQTGSALGCECRRRAGSRAG
jgi:hypothetical protein